MEMLSFVKTGISLGTGLGASMITGYAIKSVLPTGLGKMDKILVGLGTFAVSGAVAVIASTHVENTMKEIEEIAKNVFKKSPKAV